MTELKRFQNSKLHENLLSLAAKERSLTKEILLHIAEIDLRKLFLQMAFASLFEYLTKSIGYSEGAAQRRIDAARLLQLAPEIAEQIDSGALNLNQISKLQKVCRKVKKQTGVKVEAAEKLSTLKKLAYQGSAQTDLILAQDFHVELKPQKVQVQKDESVNIQMTFSKEEIELIRQAQEILSHKTGGDLKATLVQMAKETVSNAKPKTSTATVAVKSVTPKLKLHLKERDQCCQYRDPKTGKMCGSKFYLDVDHTQPRFAGGSHSTDNLRIYCRNHNQYRYRAGI